MYDNTRVPSYMNVSSHPYRLQSSRWSLDTPTTTTTSSSSNRSSFCFPHTPVPKQVLTPTYVNYYSSPSSSSVNHYERPKSTIICDSISNNPPSTVHVNDLRQRFESKAVVGIVKPMVHQRSHQSKFAEMISMTDSYYPPSSRSIPSPSPSSVLYRTRPPPIAPRRYSSINNSNKPISSHRSSRTTSTSSSIVALNEHEQFDDDMIIIDVKRLEMFYGSVGTLVKAARCIARLFITTTRQLANFEDWSCQQLGVPIWIYNTGANLKRTRQVKLVLAQHETCFALWSNLISDQAELRLPKENYITCWLPNSNMLVVFKFERDDACRLFFRHYYEILQYERRMNLANPPPLPADNPSQDQQKPTTNKEIPRRYSRLRTITQKNDKEQEQQQFELRRCRSLSKIRTVKKSDISGPINFEHVNHLSGGCQKQLRPLHASMSHLPNHIANEDRLSKVNKKRASASFEPKATAV